MKLKLPLSLLAGALVASPALLQAAPAAGSFTGHYVAGVDGIKGSSVPPPGFYIRDYNVVYTAGQLNDAAGSKVPIDFNAFVYANVLRGIWVTDRKVLGGNYFCDALVPFEYTGLKINGMTDSRFGVGDVYLEPAAVAWHGQRYDAAVGYAFWAPTGESKPGSANPGKGFWGHMITVGGTYYFDDAKTWSLSALNRYEFNQEERDTHITPGQDWTLEWGLGKAVSQTVEAGLAGYYQLETTKDSGLGTTGTRNSVIGVGPEVSVFWPAIKTFTSLRWDYEVAAYARPQGHTITLTITKPF
jgi:hypothetical protein